MKQFVMSRYINIRKYFKLIHYPLHFILNLVEKNVADGFLIWSLRVRYKAIFESDLDFELSLRHYIIFRQRMYDYVISCQLHIKFPVIVR